MQDTRTNSKLLLIVVAVLAATFGYFAQRQVAGGSGGSAMVGEQRIDFSLPDLDGRERHLSEWDGKVMVVNFWATWCPPCRKEIPEFVELQSQYADRNVQFIGVAMDRPEEVREFVRDVRVNYPQLVGDEEGTITRKFGNKLVALPYTVVIDRTGKVVVTRRGLFDAADLESTLRSLL